MLSGIRRLVTSLVLAASILAPIAGPIPAAHAQAPGISASWPSTTNRRSPTWPR